VSIAQETVSSENGVAWVVAGTWQTSAGEKLTVDQGMWWLDEKLQLAPQTSDARLLFVTLNRVL
jgi:hypothetical protein